MKQINDLKKEANKREQQKKEMADVIEQGSLIELKGRRPGKLPEVFIRPALDGKRLPGEVEIHQNGIRYQSLGSQKVGKCWYILFLNKKSRNGREAYRRSIQQHQAPFLPIMWSRISSDCAPAS